MKRLKIIFLLTLNSFIVFGQEQHTKTNEKIILDFIQTVKSKQKELLSSKTAFPLNREYPLPSIKTKQEFLNRFNEVFDDSLTKLITASNPSSDWSVMGWRGIMLYDGLLWLDDDGKLIAVNYQSKTEHLKRNALIKAEKESLYESIRKFKQPICILETAKYRIRIDELENGEYRYSSWQIKNKMSDKPDLVLTKGNLIFDGSGGNHRYEFNNAEYKYECSIIVLGEEDSPPALLIIYKGEKEILSQKAYIKGK